MGFGSRCTQSGWNFFRCSATEVFIFAADATLQEKEEEFSAEETQRVPFPGPLK